MLHGTTLENVLVGRIVVLPVIPDFVDGLGIGMWVMCRYTVVIDTYGMVEEEQWVYRISVRDRRIQTFWTIPFGAQSGPGLHEGGALAGQLPAISLLIGSGDDNDVNQDALTLPSIHERWHGPPAKNNQQGIPL